MCFESLDVFTSLSQSSSSSSGVRAEFPETKKPESVEPIYGGEKVNIRFLTREEGLRTPVIERLREVGLSNTGQYCCFIWNVTRCLYRRIKAILDYYYSADFAVSPIL